MTTVGVPITSLPSATLPLSGTEEIPLVQGGVTKKTPSGSLPLSIPDGSITNAKLADMDEALVKGREAGAGTGPPQDLNGAQVVDIVPDGGLANAKLANMGDATIKGRVLGSGLGVPVDLSPTESADIIWDEFFNNGQRRLDQNIGYLTMPSSEVDGATFDVSENDAQFYYFQRQANTSNITIPAESIEDLGDGFIISFGVSNAGGAINILADSGVTIVNLADGNTGDISLSGFGMVTVWKAGTDLWHCNGTNVTMV